MIKRVHPAWAEIPDIAINSHKILKNTIGRYQYVYSSNKGEISLIELPNYFSNGITYWEIYSTKGDLFEDVERFDTKAKAEIRIKKLLD